MDFLIVTAANNQLAFDVAQVDSVALFSPDAAVPLATLLGAKAFQPCARALVCRDREQRPVIFGVEGVRQHDAAPDSVFHLPRMLQRFRPPRWLHGFLVVETELVLVVNPPLLADASNARALPRSLP